MTYVQSEVSAAPAGSRFLWWLATAEPELLSHCTIDRNRFRIIGLTVLCTWLFATLAWSYFFFTVSASWWVSLAGGLIMGFIILCIDRALIKGISGKQGLSLGSLLLRMALALTIGLFMAQPAILFLFDKEVRMQASIDDEARLQSKRRQLDSLYAAPLAQWQQQRQQAVQALSQRQNLVEQSRQQYLAETDGTGGSGKIGISNIALAKKAELQKQEAALAADAPLMQASISQADSAILQLRLQQAQRQAAFDGLLQMGFLTRIEALHHLISENKALALRYYLVVVLLLLIELMPLLSKMLMPTGTYDAYARMTEASEQRLAQKRLALHEAQEESLMQKQYAMNEALQDALLEHTRPIRLQEATEQAAQWKQTPGLRFRQWWLQLSKRLFFDAR